MNSRKIYAECLARKSVDDLRRELRKTAARYGWSQRNGYMAMTAVLYFDLQQIRNALRERIEGIG